MAEAEPRGRAKEARDAGAARLAVRRTAKLYVGGAFPRSESGRSYPVTSAKGQHLANAAAASRKDARDAVVAARAAFGGWSGRTGYNRGQILYRIAEMMEGRHAQFVAEVVDADGVARNKAAALVSAAIDRWVYYAGWADKFSQVIGGSNAVSGPYLNLSSPEPTGVVAVIAPPQAPLFGLVSVVAPVIATGNTAVVVASERAPLPAVTLAEVLATSDLPGGVANILTGRLSEIAPHLATHADVNALDLAGAGDLAAGLEKDAAATLKRVLRPDPAGTDWTADPGLTRITPFLELKTVWHPVGV
ncbi:acyl-CoA reductase-like NAD-dependent aldehyde dehydrogenase [Lipingzhangella halophila]|uniref:Acyl-CoA reductase-like NAD-dependent aldehyde dehydrogenase n=1 Tax=Lipingzhangella halophila TaxID=1783352 RepID=A0A7W7RE82_9ACTN|nr:aldehyde dehydrogenase family protein [Lipingzhangella halophila]MBB4930200.1 acyl-CoA reductase-like NAD-dependent aldehyde dehydrogenase [Lipingzhangella halophila]